MKRLYFDVCVLCRPFDNQQGMRVRLETDAYFMILQSIRGKRYELITSAAHKVEIQAIEEALEREQIEMLLTNIGKPAAVDLAKARARAEALVACGFGIADAAHLAYAEQAADAFLTCDDRLLKRCRRERVVITVLNPIEFCAKENLR